MVEKLGKQEAIVRLLTAGKPAAELVRQGYSKGTVYKMARRVTALPAAGREGSQAQAEAAVEGDPDIVRLKKKLRKAQLERQIREARAPLEVESRLLVLDGRVAEVEQTLEETREATVRLGDALKASPLSRLRGRFSCGCGAKGHVAVSIKCTSCDTERWWGWFPNGRQ
ncbi:MAG: hypothetical protein HY330_06740 [Chloroflexi bacterium]|nr:hypothetical protein [Chloroflexota bacterium]